MLKMHVTARNATVWCGLVASPFLLYFMVVPQQPINVPGVSVLLHNVKVVTCSTTPVQHEFDFTVNVCSGMRWRGYGWKLKQLLKYARTEHNDTILVLVDGADSFVNHEVYETDFYRRFDGFDADIVVASEESCSAYDPCDMDMITTLYGNTLTTKSPFVNSPIAGKSWALQEAIVAMIRFLNNADSGNDQVAVTNLVSKYIQPAKPLRIYHDVHQQFFGSFVHVVPLVPGERLFRRKRIFGGPIKYTCADEDGNAFIYSCIDVDIKHVTRHGVDLLDGQAYVVDDETCDVSRTHSELYATPLFWHGNGPGRYVFSQLQKIRLRCLSQRFVISN